MKNSFTIFPLASNASKRIALIISIVGILLVLLHSLGIQFQPIEQFTNERSGSFFLLISIIGFYMMAFSKEKIEDERVQKIRSSALRVSLGTLLGGMIAFLFTTFISNSELSITNDSLIVFILFALGVYHLFFHISLYFDPKWAYGDNSAMENIRKNKAFFIVYTLVTVIAIGLAIFL